MLKKWLLFLISPILVHTIIESIGELNLDLYEYIGMLFTLFNFFIFGFILYKFSPDKKLLYPIIYMSIYLIWNIYSLTNSLISTANGHGSYIGIALLFLTSPIKILGGYGGIFVGYGVVKSNIKRNVN